MRRALLALLLGTTSCARCNGSATTTDAAPAASSSVPTAGGGRCTPIARHVRGGLAGEAETESPVAFGAELGGVVSDAQAFYVGLRTAGSGGEAMVLRFPHDGAAPTVVTTLAKAPGTRPPQVAIDPKGGVLVGALVRGFESTTFDLRTPTASLGTFPQAVDESESTVLLATAKGTLVAWDDTEGDKVTRGRVRVIAWSGQRPTVSDAGSDAGASDAIGVASAKTSDAQWPLLVPSPDGARAVLLWLAERPEEIDDHDGAAGEPSQDNAQRWVEAVLVDVATGATIGAPRMLTAQTGHAQTMTATWTASGLFVVVRDDPRPTDGDGGSLIAVRALVDAAIAEPTRKVVAEKDVAPGVAAALPFGAGILASFLAPDGRARLVPAFADGPATTEPALEHRRVLAARGPIVLATRLAGSALDFALVRCNL